MAKKIIIADDEWELRNLIKLLLEDYDLMLFEAEDGDTVLEIAGKEENIDLFMLDNNMPGLTGYELIQKIKVDQKLKNIPIIMLTGKRFDEEMQKMIERDVSSYLMKPFEEDKVLEAVEKVLGKLEKKGAPEELSGMHEIGSVAQQTGDIEITPQSTPEAPSAGEGGAWSPFQSGPQEVGAPEPEVPSAPQEVGGPQEVGAPEVPAPEAEPEPVVPAAPEVPIPAAPDVVGQVGQVGQAAPQQAESPARAAAGGSVTSFYLVNGMSVKKLVCSICGVDSAQGGSPGEVKSILLISYGDTTNQNDLNNILDSLGGSLSVATIAADVFKAKLGELQSMGGLIIQINPETFKKL